jgi:hypothetical protein
LAWNGQWSTKVDGTEINDRDKWWVAAIPELENMAEQDVIMADVAGDYPVFIRSQPRAGPITINIAMAKGCTEPVWQTRLEDLKALFAQGVKHVLTVQVRGMAATKTLKFITVGMTADYRQRIVSVRTISNKPVLE